jgi:hypothetical protein
MSACLINPDAADTADAWVEAFQSEILRAVRLSTHWRRLRHAIRDTLGLDRTFLHSLKAGQRLPYVTNTSYNRCMPHRHQYLRVARESPHLLWLFDLVVRRSGLRITTESDGVAALKQRLRADGVGNAGWRYVIRSTQKQWEPLLARTDQKWWAALCTWLKVMQAIRRQVPLPAEVLAAFGPTLSCRDGELAIQGIPVQAGTVRSLLLTAEQRLADGQLQAFLDHELVDVLTWLKCERLSLDANQLRQGWTYLTKRAASWCAEQEAEKRSGVSWHSILPVMELAGYHLVPLSNAYELWREGVSMRHCIGNEDFTESCDLNELRVFSIRHEDRRVATLSIRRTEGGWVGDQTLGFANQPVEGHLVGLEHEVAERYNDLAKVLDPESLGAELSRCVARDDDGEPDADEDEPFAENACPICGVAGDDCGHVVAMYDVTFGELEGGALYDAYDGIRDAIERGIRRTIGTDDWIFGVSDDIYRIPSEVPSGATDEEIDQILANHSGEIKALIFDRLETCCPDVVTTEWEFDAQRPGGCSWYKGYWANDPEAVVDWLRAEFEVEVAVNPMRPAVDAYEAAGLRKVGE